MNPLSQLYPITRAIWLGPFASPERQPALTATGITHILNVGEAPSVLVATDGPFREIVWQPITDLKHIPEEAAFECLQSLHRMVCEPEARVYLHCVAGWNRSPTILWLYLIACGISRDEAKRITEAGSPDAIPGHSRLIDAALVESVQKLGAKFFMPHPRLEAIEVAGPVSN